MESTIPTIPTLHDNDPAWKQIAGDPAWDKSPQSAHYYTTDWTGAVWWDDRPIFHEGLGYYVRPNPLSPIHYRYYSEMIAPPHKRNIPTTIHERT